MQPPLSVGTVLQNRYRLLKILGQGGFGRTYLAEDTGRFKEKCALKEFIPVQAGGYAPQKSKELFQREAAILYQIQHPQIPQFRATIEQDGRLFLVQDYVEGKTYSALLSDRKYQRKTFSESEVLQLLQQMLPVLDHIHAKGIIHRDISPDNIILRDRDRLPVLIDFGVVKELVTKFQSPQKTPTVTTVGKMGYAPPEQIQTGRAYPSSDLYALAVTCAVLLTGQDPQGLYDEGSLSWAWYRWIQPINPGLTAVLNRMLSYKPSDRYSDAREVAIALKSAYNNPSVAKVAPTQVQASPASQPSQMQTLGVNRPGAMFAATAAPIAQSQYPPSQPVVALPAERSSWDNPLLVIFVGMFLAIVAGVGSWAIVSTILNNPTQVKTILTPIPTNTVFNSPTDSTPTPTPTEVSTPTPEPEPVTANERLNLLVDDSLSTPGNLKTNETVNYIINAAKGQQLSASLDEEGVLLTILGPNEQPVDERSTRVTRWEGVLPENGNYTVQLRTVKGIQDSAYRLNLRLTNPEPKPTPTPELTPTPTATPTLELTPTPTPTLGESPLPGEEFKIAPPATNEYDEEPLDLPPGNASAQISGTTNRGRVKRYLVYAQAGQVLSARIQTGAAVTRLDIRYPNGKLVDNASGLGEWEGKIDSSGEYQIDVKTTEGSANFTIEVNVKQ